MTSIERTAYPRLEPSPSTTELAEVWSPKPEDVKLGRAITRGEDQLLSFVLMISCFRRLGYFPRPDTISEAVVSHVRSRLGLSPQVTLVLPERSLYRYQAAIRRHLGVQVSGETARHLAATVMTEAALTMDNPADLINVAIEELIKERFELPAFTTLERMARHLRRMVNARLFAQVDERLTARGGRRLDTLLEAGASRRSELNILKATPGSATKKNLKELQERLLWLESLGNTEMLLEGIPEAKVAHLASQARALDAAELGEVEDHKRRAMLVCLIERAKVTSRDGLAQMLIKTMAKIHNRAKEALEELHRERRATTEALIEILERILAGAVRLEDNAALGKNVRELLAEGGGPEALLAASTSLSTHRGGNYLPLMWKVYKGQRATLFRVARSLSILSSTEDHSLVYALNSVLENDQAGRRGEFVFGELDLSFASQQWRDFVEVDLNGTPALDRRYLEVCIFSHVAAELKTGDLCVEGSEEYADYRDQLLSWEKCEPMVDQQCAELGLSCTPERFVTQLRDLLSGTAEEVDRSYPDNASVVITEDGQPVLKKASGKKPTSEAKILESAIAGRMPERDLVDVICSGEHWTNWSRHLGPLSGSEPKLERPRERYLVTAFGYGTNMGPVQTARHTRGLASAHELGYVNRRHITTQKLEAAITDVVNAYAGMDLPRVWGSGETAAADGTKLELRRDNLLSEYHVRYGGYGGIAYHHVADTYIAFFTHFIACGVWEAVYIIDGLLKNASELQPKAIASDTQGQSITVFGLSHMLGIELMPRIRKEGFGLLQARQGRHLRSHRGALLRHHRLEAHPDSLARPHAGGHLHPGRQAPTLHPASQARQLLQKESPVPGIQGSRTRDPHSLPLTFPRKPGASEPDHLGHQQGRVLQQLL